MSTNPNNAVGTNAAYGGRTSVKAFNDNIGAYSRGIISGWACSPSSGMTVTLGGDGTTRDIAIAEDVSGNKITVNNISEAPINVTMSAAPSSKSRIDLIVAYVDNPPQGSATVLDNPAACGLITVRGTAAANPVAPSESAIRTAITADGASGSTAYYVILAQITIAAGTTDIVAGNISAGSSAGIGAKNVDFATFSTTAEIPCGTWVDGKTIYKKTIYLGALPNAGTKDVLHRINNISYVCGFSGIAYRPSDDSYFQLSNAPHPTSGLATSVNLVVTGTKIIISAGINRSDMTGYCTIYYTKTN